MSDRYDCTVQLRKKINGQYQIIDTWEFLQSYRKESDDSASFPYYFDFCTLFPNENFLSYQTQFYWIEKEGTAVKGTYSWIFPMEAFVRALKVEYPEANEEWVHVIGYNALVSEFSYEGPHHKGYTYVDGKYIFADGRVYEGDWFDGNDGSYPVDYGKMTYANGDIYKGWWTNGKPHGKGMYFHISGEIYEGDYVDGKRHGKGRYIFADGRIEEGVFENDEFAGKKKKSNKLTSQDIDKIHDELIDETETYINNFTFMYNYVNKYFNRMDDLNKEEYKFNVSQISLLGFYFLFEHARDQELIFLFKDGYCGYIINNRLTKSIKSWGAVELSKIIEEMIDMYNKNKEIIKRKTKEIWWDSSPEIKKIVDDFATIGEKYLIMLDNQLERIKEYVDNNKEKFEIIEKKGKRKSV